MTSLTAGKNIILHDSKSTLFWNTGTGKVSLHVHSEKRHRDIGYILNTNDCRVYTKRVKKNKHWFFTLSGYGINAMIVNALSDTDKVVVQESVRKGYMTTIEDLKRAQYYNFCKTTGCETQVFLPLKFWQPIYADE